MQTPKGQQRAVGRGDPRPWNSVCHSCPDSLDKLSVVYSKPFLVMGQRLSKATSPSTSLLVSTDKEPSMSRHGSETVVGNPLF